MVENEYELYPSAKREFLNFLSEEVQYMLDDISDETIMDYVDNALRAQLSRDMYSGNLKARVNLPHIEEWDDQVELAKKQKDREGAA